MKTKASSSSLYSYIFRINPTLIKYTIVPSIPLIIIAILSTNPNTWIASDVDHFYFEIIAVIFASIVAFYCITRAYTLNDKYTLFIGIGFLTSALIDLMHAIISYNAMDDPLFLGYFIPQTWFAGRTFISAMIVIAITRFAIIPKDSQQLSGKTFIAYLSLIVILAVSVSILSFLTIFPGVLIDFPLHRPYEIPSLILFSIALVYFYKNQLHRRNDVFYKGILGSLIIDIFAQIIMSSSLTFFESGHNVAHILKDTSYFVIIIALALSSVQYNKRLREREKEIRVQYDKLKEADKAQREFINVAAHELRTPIQPVLSLSDILHSKIKDSKQRELLDVVIRNAKRLQRLSEDILDVTRIESQSLILNKEQFNLNDVISNAIQDHKNEIEKTNGNLKLLYKSNDYEDDNIFVEADRTRLSQVISNLIRNAIKFTKEGIILITARKDNSNNSNNQVIISVKDTGSGIDPEILPRLFSKFATKSFEGTGLGLFISKSIIEDHGGRIWAENNPDGKGATFSFSIPIISARQANIKLVDYSYDNIT
ncbi:MAG TPA: ATP-binding protein [Nitrososphaeraceae archaeon]|nr:ATP-binding protein [Nitrososphaeraceae archaeon]